MTERIMPQSLEAEQHVIGAQLIEPAVVVRVAELVGVDDFYREMHGMLQGAILAVDSRGDRADLFGVVEELRRTGNLGDDVTAYLLACIEGCPGSQDVESYCRVVAEKSVLRQAITAAHEIESLAYEAQNTDGLIESAERIVLDLGKRRTVNTSSPLGALVDAACKRMAWLADNPDKRTGVSTGFAALDEITSGLQPQDLIILAARPSMGKTGLSLQIAYNIAAKEQRPAVVFSLEMSKEQLVQRLLSGEARVNSKHMRDGTLSDEEWERIDRVQAIMRRHPMHVIDTPQLTTMAMRSHCRRVAQKHGPLGVVMVDYIQLAHTHQKYGSRVEQLSLIGKDLKALGREMNCPVLALSQLSRAVEQREDKRPILSDLRESGTLEEDADLVAFIYRPAYYENKAKMVNRSGVQFGPDEVDQGIAEVIVSKFRNGPTGIVRLEFEAEYAHFKDLGGSYVN